MIAYYISLDCFEIGTMLPIKQYQLLDFSDLKRKIEQTFEIYRSDNCPDLSSRLSCRFISATTASAEFWAQQKFSKQERDYYLYEVEIADEASVQWHDAEPFDMIANNCYPSGITKEDCIKRYWNLCSYEEAINNYESEGICTAPTVINSRTAMHISNGIVTNLSNSYSSDH